jgi:chemosensory pili system protein ChpA (sensor histidine kinase/response regulator)
MTDRRDYIALEWLGGEIAESLRQCDVLLSNFLHSSNHEALERAAALMHQVQGSLRMVEFSGAALLVDEMEQTIAAVIRGGVAESDYVKAVKYCVEQLPGYLQKMLKERRELPASLILIFNELRMVSGAALLSSSVLFNPKLDAFELGAVVDSSMTEATFVELSGKLLKMYQIAITAYLRGGNDKQNLLYVGKVCGRAAKLCAGQEQQVLWLAALALVEGLLNESIASYSTTGQLLGQLGEQLARFPERGLIVVAEPLDQTLLKNILFYIASSGANSRYILETRQRHHLQSVFDASDEFTSASINAAEGELRTLAKDLVEANDFVELNHRCHQLNDTLAVLGLLEPLYSLRAMTEILNAEMSVGSRQSLSHSLLRLADRLVDNSAASDLGQEIAQDTGQGGPRQPQQAPDRNKAAVVADSRAILFETQEAIIAYVSAEWQSNALSGFPEQLRELATRLEELEFTSPASILNSCAGYLADVLIAQGMVPEWYILDALADALTSVDYYLERCGHGQQFEDQGLLVLAERCVEKLGYPVNLQLGSTGTVLPWPEKTSAFSGAEAAKLKPEESKPEERANTIDDLDPEIVEVFLEEADEVLSLLKQSLPQWQEQLGSEEYLDTVRRAFHTLKGSGRMVGAIQIAELGWAVEAMLNKVVDGRFVMDEPRLQLIENVTALLPKMINELAAGRELPADAVFALTAFANALSKTQSPSEEGADEEGLRAIFVSEADTHLRVLEEFVESIDSYPVKLTDEVQRALHTLKGSSKMAEVHAIANIITPLEALVKELRSMRVAAGEELILLIADVTPEVRNMIAELARTSAVALPTPGELLARVNSLAAQLISEAESAVDRSSRGELESGALDAFLTISSDTLQSVQDLIDPPAQPEAAAVVELAPVMGLFAQRSEEINGEVLAELAQTLQVLLSQACDPLPKAYIDLLSVGVEQLMENLNQLAGEQTVTENTVLLDRLRDFDFSGQQLSEASSAASLAAEQQTLLEADIEVFDAEPEEKPEEIAASDSSEDTIDPEILEIFIEEAGDLIESMDLSLHSWSEDRHNHNYLDNIKRDLHTLKGGARLSGMSELGDISHDFETAIVTAITKKTTLDDSFLNCLQQFQDQIVHYVAALSNPELVAQDAGLGSSVLPPVLAETQDLAPAKKAAHTLPQQLVSEAIVEAGGALSPGAGRAAPQEMIKVPSQLLERLINLAGETSIARGRVEEQVSEIHFSLEEMEMTVVRMQDQVRRLDMETEAQIIFRQEQVESEGAEGFDPLEFDRYSQLQQLSRSLLESASDLTDLRGTLVEKSRDMETLLIQQSRVNTELQEGLMRSQMVQFSRMVPRLRRGVRQMARELDKSVEFNAYNGEGEMDRRVLERIIPALEHILRNAVAHGIETPEQRQQAGKNASGTVAMRFDRQGGDVVITISDDGGGIDLEAVRAKAEDLGLIKSDAVLSERQLLEYIFHAGFSTASTITQIAGRGVGMDVVRSEIKQLGGAIDIQTQRGQGSQFEIRLPFTVSVNRALMVSVGGEIFAVPLNNIEGIVRVSPYELDVYYQDGGPAFEYAGQDYKLRYLGQLLGVSGAPNLEGQTEPRPVLLIRNAEPPTAVQIDSLMGSREVVVKTLGPQFAAVPGLSGATVLGDGSVVVILDMLASVRADIARNLLGQQSEIIPVIAKKNVRLVMVVDDSVTVRKVTSRLLSRQHMEVALARDGLDAVAQLQDSERLPDVILLDIEMPRMDGFEVASRVRSNPRTKDIPIIMISSRTGQKHRQRALRLGVRSFLGKPYQEIQLLKAIDEVIKPVEQI